MIHLGVRSIPKVLSWFQTQTAGTRPLTGTHRWYVGMLPLKLKGFPWQASSRAETPTLLWPKRRIEGGCSTSKTLAWSGENAPQKHLPPRVCGKKKNLPGMRDTSWQMSLHLTTSCWGQLPYIPKVAGGCPFVLVAQNHPKKKTCWSQNFESEKTG